jgi:uncharacterized protein (DUF4213/DUF364 family)
MTVNLLFIKILFFGQDLRMLDDLIKTLSDTDKQMRLRRVVMGLCYIAVQLENGNVGLGANISNSRTTDCAVFDKAGTLKGSFVGEILRVKERGNLLFNAVCLASINALKNIDGCGLSGDIFDEILLNKGDRAVMIGNIAPVAAIFKNKGCIINVYDNRFDGDPLLNNQEPMDSACSRADIIVITATSIINYTINDILKFSKKAREVIIMGPSTPMAHTAFISTPISYLAGSQVTDAEKALDIVMEGGGTPLLYRSNAMKKIFHKVFQIVLLILLVSIPYHAQAASIKYYLPFSAELYTKDTKLARIALRKFSKDEKIYYLAVKPDTLHTEIVPESKYRTLKKSFSEIRAKNSDLIYFKAIAFAENNSRPLQNAGITRIPGTNAVYLTADLCPTARPLDREFFKVFISEYGKYHKPAPLSLSVTGRWMEKHPDDLKWLTVLEAQKEISITWINHSYTHFYRKGLPLTNNFLLHEGTNLENEILQTEISLIEAGTLPSVFFRFPGLVSSHGLFLRVTGYGLIPIGSDAWLAKNQEPEQPGSIILVHANGNEPEGTARFHALLRKKKKDITGGRWLMGDLRTGIIESMKIY